MQILLTGATGFLGNNLLRMLLEDGHQVRVTTRQQSKRRCFDGLDVEIVECDLNDGSEIGATVRSSDIVIHAAAHIQIGWSQLEKSRQVNVRSTEKLAQSARLHNARMILVSSVDTLKAGTETEWIAEDETEPPKNQCSYVISKREAEGVFRQQIAAGLDGVIVNPGFMLGPWDWKPSSGQMLLAVKNCWTPLAPAGGCSVVDVRDVACGILSAMQHGKSGENYILGGENLSYYELWCRIAGLTGGRAPVGKLPGWISFLAGKFGDLRTSIWGTEPPVNSAATQLSSLYNWYSSDKATQELGYQIGSVDVAIEDAWNWFQSYGYV